MFVCAENPRTSHYVMALMQDQALVQEFSRQQKMDSLRFADASTARMKPGSVTELTAHYSIRDLVNYLCSTKAISRIVKFISRNKNQNLFEANYDRR